MVSVVHQRLRVATRADHERLESRADLIERVSTPAGRRSVVQRFWRLHAEVEAAVAPWLAELDGLDFQDRRRTERLSADLETLGLEAPSEHAHGPDVGSLAEALGHLYVLEGSTLGGRTIRRSLDALGSDMHGLSFLDPYGERTGERWRAFLDVLDRHAATPQAVEATVRGAVAGFRHAERRICEGQAA
ncbi:biliverdin-producing heme oxygenase [Phenylobacterium sp. VNQ135]|uniref:biliverdin-producing heme oxygenase n=1 Tax=Phenylobacterium sp. VNQ135 TaxID=3400922 RepID=UPI003C128C1D